MKPTTHFFVIITKFSYECYVNITKNLRKMFVGYLLDYVRSFFPVPYIFDYLDGLTGGGSGLKWFTTSRMIRQEIVKLKKSFRLVDDLKSVRYSCLMDIVADSDLKTKIFSLIQCTIKSSRDRSKGVFWTALIHYV